MIARRRQAALALTALLAAGAACQAQHRQERHAAAGHAGPSATAARPAAGGFTLVASGDILPDGPVADRAGFDAGGAGHDFRPMLEGVKPLVSAADVALCQTGTPYGAPGVAAAGAPRYSSPPELAEALAATGYDSCSTASEHTLDGGTDGVRRTLDALDRAGVRHAGSARTDAEARGVTLLRAGHAVVAHLAYTYGTNGPLPAGQPWALALLDENRVLADARAARRAGADVVVVSLHWGWEWQEVPDARQVALVRRLTAARDGDRPAVDLILGTHAHVPQAYEKVNGTWVVYGLGDQITGGTGGPGGLWDPRANQSTLARFTFRPPARPGGRWEVARAEFFPEMFDLDAGRVVDLGEAVAQGADLEGVRDRIRGVVLARGAAKDGLVMGQ
ncbi:CapA family protein [Streptomyces sp. NPDC004065]|uniref:CapA family protein n=1 Tax=Streptomyces sp. NPDC004065 TaxID=3364689 RepID=UPI00384E54F2